MSKMTFVVEFPDAQEPVISAATDILGGKLLSAAFKDATEVNVLSMVRFSLQCGAGGSTVLGEFMKIRAGSVNPLAATTRSFMFQRAMEILLANW